MKRRKKKNGEKKTELRKSDRDHDERIPGTTSTDSTKKYGSTSCKRTYIVHTGTRTRSTVTSRFVYSIVLVVFNSTLWNSLG
jgi:hypothetical protein